MIYKCKGREKKYMEDYREANKEKAKVYAKSYRNVNREKIKIRQKNYYKSSRKNLNNRARIYRNLHKEEIKEKKKGYREANKEKIKLRKGKYYQTNKKDISRKKKIYRNLHKQGIKARHKSHYQANKEKIISCSRANYSLRKEEENKRRKKLGLPLVGEGFKKEMELLFYVSHVFEGETIISHDRTTLGGLELDVYIPSLKLAFEYQGRQHYGINTIYIKTKEELQALQFRDRRKKELCKEKGIILIEVKFDEKLSEQLILKKLQDYDFNLKQKRL